MADVGTTRGDADPASLGFRNSLLAARSRRHTVKEFPGPLSIKTVVEGRVAWKIERREVWVDDSSFLVLNDGERYSMEIEASEPVSTCCVFFAKGFVEAIMRGACAPIEKCLDDPHRDPNPIPFLSSLLPRNDGLFSLMGAIRECALGSAPALEMDELYLRLASELLLQYAEARNQMTRISAARVSTRAELFSRVSRGREFLHAEAYNPVTLGTAARASGMSPYHFHRTFRQAFGKSPARYVADLRFAKAIRLLRVGLPVTEVCRDVGFESLGSFSTAFRRYFGVPPSSFHPGF
jgi:AraC family transcriptional regulator